MYFKIERDGLHFIFPTALVHWLRGKYFKYMKMAFLSCPIFVIFFHAKYRSYDPVCNIYWWDVITGLKCGSY